MFGKKKIYRVTIICDNCGKPDDVDISFGMNVLDFLKNVEIVCENCGCLMDVKEYKTRWIK